jgi:uncharacterized membrane protein
MKLRKLTKQKIYLIGAIIGVIMVLLGIYLFIDAFKQNDNFRIFMWGILLIFWIVYTIIFANLYTKETRSSSS